MGSRIRRKVATDQKAKSAVRAAVEGTLALAAKLEELERRMFGIAVTQDVLIGLTGLGERLKAEVEQRAKAYTDVKATAAKAPEPYMSPSEQRARAMGADFPYDSKVGPQPK